MNLAQRLLQTGLNEVPEESRVFGNFRENDTLLILSRKQTSGRGRSERAWHSESDGGLYLSFLFDFQKLQSPLSSFSLVAGLAVQRAVVKYGLRASLKWPNDVLLQGPGENSYRKLAGILAESSSGPGLGQRVSLGIGLNVEQREFPPHVPGVSMLQAYQVAANQLQASEVLKKPKPEYFSVLASLVVETLGRKQEFEVKGFSAFRDAWWQGSMMRDRVLTVGEDKTEYRAVGIAEDGALELCSLRGERRVLHSGEIQLSGVSLK